MFNMVLIPNDDSFYCANPVDVCINISPSPNCFLMNIEQKCVTDLPTLNLMMVLTLNGSFSCLYITDD